MSFIPTEEDLSKYGSKPWGKRDQYIEGQQEKGGVVGNALRQYGDYLKGAGAGLLQSGAEGGRSVAMLPSTLYEMATDEPLYDLPKPDVLGFAPQSDAGQLGKGIGQFEGDAFKTALESLYGGQALGQANRYHPLTKRLMGRQIQNPLNAAEEAGARFNLSPRQMNEANELLSHPALSAEGQTSKALTPMGRESLMRGLQQGGPQAGHSVQSLMGELMRTIPRLGESQLANARVRPLQESILDAMMESMEDAGVPEEARNYQAGREGARRYYRTQAGVKRAAKAVSPMTYLKMALSALKGSP